MRGLKFNRVRGAEVGILPRGKAAAEIRILLRRQVSAAEGKFHFITAHRSV